MSSVNTSSMSSARYSAIFALVAGIIGSMGSFLLLYEKMQVLVNPDHIISCNVNPWISCGEVMASWQASTFGFPNIFIGVVAFPLLILASVAVLSALSDLSRSKLWWGGLSVGAVFSLGFITWLWYSSLFSIGALCPYCMIVWLAVFVFFFSTMRHVISEDVFCLNIPESIKVFTSSWWWVFGLLCILGVIASMFLVFPQAFSAEMLFGSP